MATAGLLLIACASPTLPLPPPALPSFTNTGLAVGEVELSSVSGAEPNALIVIYNQGSEVPDDKRVGGAQADGDGSWNAVITGQTGDYLEIFQIIGTETSTPVSVSIPAL
jgi:hypothetical protein